ncbi:MAG: hypothetical protein ACK47Z_08815 [Paracoccaceae bacterium]
MNLDLKLLIDKQVREAPFCGVRRMTCHLQNEAIPTFGPPEIMNTDQGSQFTSVVWTGRPKRVGPGYHWTPPSYHLHRAPVAVREA